MSINKGKLPTSKHHAREWSEEEKELVFNIAGTMPIEDVLIQINKISPVKRSILQLRGKASKMGWKLRYPPLKKD